MTPRRGIVEELRRRSEVETPLGPGEARNNLVSVTVDAANRICRITFTERLARVTSDRLAGAVLNAYVDACSASTRQQRLLPVGVATTQRSADAPPPEDVGLAALPLPRGDELEACDVLLQHQVDELALLAKDEADRLERVTATSTTEHVAVTVTATGRLRRITFRPTTAAVSPPELARELMSALAQAEREARAAVRPC